MKRKNNTSIESVSKPVCTAVIVAAGSSSRMGGQDKLMLMLGGMPVLARTLMAFQLSDSVERIVIVTRPEKIILVQDICKEFGITKASDILVGGATRTESTIAGVNAVSSGYAAVHDGARPFVSGELITRVLEAAAETGSAAPSLQVTDTVKRIDKDGFIVETPDRTYLRTVQTPQIFDTLLLRAALNRAVASGISYTDDCAAVEAMGGRVKLIEGEPQNIKLTTQADIIRAELYLDSISG